jgi:CRISPR-associated protein Csm1
VYSVWDLGSNLAQLYLNDVSTKFINGYVPSYSSEDSQDDRIFHCLKGDMNKQDILEQVKMGDPKTLNHIACKALIYSDDGSMLQGTQMLGVLKADVDHLGLLLACGLKDERFTVSRLATLSRQLNSYFAVYLPYLLQTDERFQDVYTVFAGGDDLFLIGPWNKIMELAPHIGNSFRHYVCNNPEVHLSAGISVHKPHTPIHSMAFAAEMAIEASKSGGRNRLTAFSETVDWETVQEMSNIREKLESWLDKGWFSRVFFYRLNEFIRMVTYEKQLSGATEIRLSDMACTKWRAMLVYSAERNIAKNLKGEERKKIVHNVTQTITGWLETHGSKLKIPVWNILYDRR